MKLHEYITKWNDAPSPKSANETDFIDLFIDYLKSIDDCRDVQFDGDGAYFGNQVKIKKDSTYIRVFFGFEIAYQYNYAIKVYTDRHEGYWTPEYINVSKEHERFDEVANALHDCLMKNFGLNR